MPSDWQTSTLLFVRDVDVAISFYVGKLGFTLNMRYEEDGAALVAGVSRGDGCAFLLTSQWPDKAGSAVIYTAFGAAEHDALRANFIAKGVRLTDGWWGKRLMIVEDSDGNQFWFADPHDAHQGD
jgi:catechol 2,3-dioxygenase-like lactoylglutathione lyase family enzyme